MIGQHIPDLTSTGAWGVSAAFYSARALGFWLYT